MRDEQWDESFQGWKATNDSDFRYRRSAEDFGLGFVWSSGEWVAIHMGGASLDPVGYGISVPHNGSLIGSAATTVTGDRIVYRGNGIWK